MKRRLNPPADTPPDRGADGLANALRPSAVIPVANGSTAIGRESVDVKRYHDAHLFDRMRTVAQLSTRQHEASEHVLALYAAAGLEPSTTVAYLDPRLDRGEELDGEPEAGEPLALWRQFLRRLPLNEAAVIEAACLGRHPGVARLSTLQCALDRVADDLRLECR